MFIGDDIPVTSFEVTQILPAKRVRLVASVNGVTCFVKTFGDPVVMCAADELKTLVGVQRLGCSRAIVPDYGAVLLARYLPNHRRFNDLIPTRELALQLLPVLWFDVWIRNNDRTGTNVMLLDDGGVVPIDESAAFKRPSTYRLTPKLPWYEALEPLAHAWRPGIWPPSRADIAQILRRTMPRGWPTYAEMLNLQAERMEQLWTAFWTQAKERVAC